MVDPGEPLSECNLDHELAYVGLPCPDVYIGLYRYIPIINPQKVLYLVTSQLCRFNLCFASATYVSD